MAKILLTGASGFIGGVLCKTLRERGHSVTGISFRASDRGLVACDMRDPAAVDRVVGEVEPDTVIHCGALSSVTANKAIEYYATNVVGTENLISAIAKRGQRVRFLFASTAGVYGNQKSSVLNEEMQAAPVHHYGLSKFACEQIIRNFDHLLDYTIVRPFNIIGVGQDENFVVPKVLKAFAHRDRELNLGNIDVERDYIEVDTACDILADLMECPASSGEIVNLCSGRATSLRHLIDLAQDLARYEIKVVQNPAFIRASEVWRLVGSRDKLDGLLTRPIQFRPLRDTLRDMLETYRAKG